MGQKLLAVAALMIAVIVVLTIGPLMAHYETFATREEKAKAIISWFEKNPRPSYAKYRNDLERKSNIVEYEDALNLYMTGRLTPGHLMQTF